MERTIKGAAANGVQQEMGPHGLTFELAKGRRAGEQRAGPTPTGAFPVSRQDPPRDRDACFHKTGIRPWVLLSGLARPAQRVDWLAGPIIRPAAGFGLLAERFRHADERYKVRTKYAAAPSAFAVEAAVTRRPCRDRRRFFRLRSGGGRCGNRWRPGGV